MQQFENQTFWHGGDPFSFSGAVIEKSVFNQCIVRSQPHAWNNFSDINLQNVSHWNCTVSGCAFDRVILNGLKKVGSAPLFVWSSVFQHSILSGNISGLKFNRSDLNPQISASEREWRDQAILAFYSEVDWAIDISKAKFPNGVTLESFPGDKIVRDTETQVLISRESLNVRDWRTLDFNRTAIDIALSWFETNSLFDSVVIVPRSNSKYRDADMRVIDMLRREGIAKAD